MLYNVDTILVHFKIVKRIASKRTSYEGSLIYIAICKISQLKNMLFQYTGQKIATYILSHKLHILQKILGFVLEIQKLQHFQKTTLVQSYCVQSVTSSIDFKNLINGFSNFSYNEYTHSVFFTVKEWHCGSR